MKPIKASRGGEAVVGSVAPVPPGNLVAATNGLSDRFLSSLKLPQMYRIIQAIPGAMIVIDGEGRIAFFNQTAERIFGYTECEVLGRNVTMLMPTSDREAHDEHLKRYFGTGEARVLHRTRRVFGLRRNGTTFPQEILVEEIEVDGRQMFVGFIRDLEDQEKSEFELRLLHDELLHVSRVGAMGMMATALAHELNQPLAAVTSYVQTAASLLRSGVSVDSTCDALDAAAAEAMRSGNIVRRLRDFVSRGDLERSRENLARLVADAMTLAMAGTRDLGITCQVDLAADIVVMVDRIQVQQVLVNLIRNAVDAMQDTGGTVRICARKRRNLVEITVADTGPGLAPDQISRIFDAFVSSKQDGLGIGLSICRMIVEAHGGQIWVQNRAEGGAAFSFTLPLAEDMRE